MEQFFIDYHQLSRNYSLALESAILLFLSFYLMTLISRGKRGLAPPPLSSPSRLWTWLRFLYPDWLDKLSFGQILGAFAWALGSAAVCWTLLSVAFIIKMAKGQAP